MTRAGPDRAYLKGFLEQSDLPRAGPAPRHAGALALKGVLATDELHRRPQRASDHEAENRALVALAENMERSPRTVMAAVVETAMRFCRAGSAGMGIVESDGGTGCIRWRALSGALSAHLGSVTPLNLGAWGSVLDCQAVQLLRSPARHFAHLRDLKPAVAEALLVPFFHAGRVVGTVWVAHHDDAHFDAEDARLLGDLAGFAAAAYRMTGWLHRKGRDAVATEESLAVLVHELRSPLSVLDSTMQLLQLGLLKVPNAALEAITTRSRRQIKAMSRLIDDLLDVAGLAHGKVELRRERVDLANVVQQAVDTSRPNIEAAHHELVVALPREPIWIDCDPMRIAQALTNLLNNAAKYMPAHGRIDLLAVPTRGAVSIRVRDQGIGIAARDLDRIFELFTQVDTSYRGGGLGVGLSLVKRLVEQHGGSVAAHSKGLGFGSEFVIHLPI